MRVAPPVHLSPEERAAVLRRARRAGPPGLRARIVLLAADGRTDREIGERLGVARQTSARWRQRFRASRVSGLLDDAVPLRGGRIPPETLQAIVRATLARSGEGGRPWSTRRLARAAGVSHMTVHRVWKAYALRPTRVEPFPARADPVARASDWEAIGLVVAPPLAALAVRSGGPIGPGAGSFAPSASDPSTRAAPAFRSLPAPPRRSTGRDAPVRSLLRFLSEVLSRAPPGSEVRAILGGVPPSELALLDRWRVRHPRLEVECIPDVGAWRVRIAQQLRATGRSPVATSVDVPMAEARHSLAATVARSVEDGQIFSWVASAREIARGGAAGRLRYQLAVTGQPIFKSPRRFDRGVRDGHDPGEEYRDSARSVLRRYLHVRARERVTVETWSSTLEYANAFVLESLRLGARPLVLYQDEPTYWAATTEVPAASLQQIGEHRRAALERTDVFVSFFGPSDRERFHSLPTSVRFRLGAYQDALYAAASKGGARAVQMAIGRVSEASARMYSVDLATWHRELLSASRVDPNVLRRRGRTIAQRLRTGRTLEVQHPNGTRLSLRLRGRRPHVSDGTVSRAPPKGMWSLVTLPAGVVTVALDETFAEGTFHSNVRTSTGLSDTVGEFAGATWEFARGRLRSFSHTAGQDLFAQSYGRAGDGRDRPGALSFGLNERIETSPLLEDQCLGTVGLHIGRNDFLGGATRSPWWAWTFLRGSTVTVDGHPVLREGRIVGA